MERPTCENSRCRASEAIFAHGAFAGNTLSDCRRALVLLLTSPLFRLHIAANRDMKGRANRRANAVARDLRNDSATGGAAGQGRRSAEPRRQELRAVSYDDLQVADGGTAGWSRGPHGAETSGAEARPGAAPEAPGPALDQWQGPAAVRFRLWSVDAADCGGAHRAEVRSAAGRDRGRAPARRVGHHAAETLAARLRARSRGDQALDHDGVSPPARPGQARRGEDLLPR